MPILVKDFKWSETETELFITLPLKGVKPSKADIFTTDDYIKVSYPPYLFEVHLLDSVLEEKCNVRLGNGVIEFRLLKTEEKLWGKLNETKSKEEMASKRQEAILASQKREKELKDERAKRKREEEQFAIREQMKLEQTKRENMEKQKQGELKQALDDLEIWKENTTSVKMPPAAIHTTDIWTGKTVEAPPPPRKPGQISVHFTPRAFSTAARESKLKEEEEWLSRMAAARKIKPPDNQDESLNDRNPEFIKDKGVELFKVGNYEGAINAFTKAIELNSNLPSLFSNRAACFLRIGDNGRCIVDCTRALELYYPVVPSNYLSRTKVFVRRGTAYANIGEAELALQDYSAALKLSPDNQSIKEDYSRLKEEFQNHDLA